MGCSTTPLALKDPLVVPLLALASGILIAHNVRFERGEILIAVSLLLLLWLLAKRFAPRIAATVSLITLVSSGMLLDVMHRPGPAPTLDATSRETVLFSGCVVEPPVFDESRDQFTVELAPGARARVSIPLRDGETPPDLEYGRRVELEGRLRPVRNFQNPGAFDYETYEARNQIYWTAAAAPGSAIQVLPGRCGSRFRNAIFGLRTAALRRIEDLYRGDAYATGIMEATLIGENQKLQRIWTDHFRRTGTYHMLVIDGLHITILAALFLFLLRLCFMPELAALTLAAAGAWLYAFVSGFNAPAVRAAGGFTIYLACRLVYRRRRLLNLLAAVAMVYLACDPGQLFDAGFQMSFLCVAVIAAIAAPLLECTSLAYTRSVVGLPETSRDPTLVPKAAQLRVELRLLAETLHGWIPIPQLWLLRGLALFTRLILYAYEMAIISLAIQVGLAIPMALFFHRISLSGFSANVLIVPLLAVVVPLGFLAIFTASHFVAATAAWFLLAGEKVANWHLRFEPDWRVADPPLWLALAFTAALVTFALSLGRFKRWRIGSGALLLALFALVFWHPFPPQVYSGRLELTAIDVGQGDSLLVAFPDGTLLLVDGGGILSFRGHAPPKIDIGEDVVSPYLWKRSIRKLDIVVLTHAHDDHARGLAAIIENFHPTELWTGATPPSEIWKLVQARARAENTKIIPMRSGRSMDLGGAHVEIVAPAASYEPGDTPKNDDSLAMRITYHERSFLLTGDMEKPTELRAVSDGCSLRADVLKVGHHGSNTSSTDPFLDAVSPTFAVISDGFENSFHHPHPQVLRRLEARHVPVFRTDTEGLVTFRTDGRTISIETYRPVARP